MISVAFLFSVLSVPVRAIGFVLGELPRAAVGWRPRQQRADGDRRDALRHRQLWPASGPVSADGSTTSRSRYEGSAEVLHDVTFDGAGRARPWRWSARPAPASPPSRRWPPA